VWDAGWLASLGDITGLAPGLGIRDFAGGTVVHAYAGLSCLIITVLLGPSLRRYQLNGGVRVRAEFAYKEAVEAKRPELSLAIMGTSLLFFGWFGFNGGSTLVVSEQTGYAIANTAVTGSLGGFVASLLSKAAERAWSPIMAISGIMGGLVMITPLASFVEPALAFVAGVVAGVITYYGVPVLVYGGGFGFVAVQWLGMVLALGFVAATTYVFVRLLLIKYRTTHEEEVEGLDAIDHKVGYV
jgi:Ammonia permease